MRIQAYTAYSATVTITVATPRAEPAPSTRFFFASIHEDYAASVAAALREHKHIGETALAYPAAARLQTYFPAVAGKPVYAVRALVPAGAPRDIDADWQLEIMRLRYALELHLLPAAFAANAIDAEAISRNVQNAFRAVLEAAGLSDVFIPGDLEIRPGGRSDIDIICELGPASARQGFDIPAP